MLALFETQEDFQVTVEAKDKDKEEPIR